MGITKQVEAVNKTVDKLIQILSHEDVIDHWQDILEEVTAGMEEVIEEQEAESARDSRNREQFSWTR